MFFKVSFEEDVETKNFIDANEEESFLYRTENLFVFSNYIYINENNKFYKIKNTFKNIKSHGINIKLDEKTYNIVDNILVESNKDIEDKQKSNIFYLKNNLSSYNNNGGYKIEFNDSILINDIKICENELERDDYLGALFKIDTTEIIVLTSCENDTFLYFKKEKESFEIFDLEEEDSLSLRINDSFEAIHLKDMFVVNNRLVLQDEEKTCVYKILKDTKPLEKNILEIVQLKISEENKDVLKDTLEQGKNEFSFFDNNSFNASSTFNLFEGGISEQKNIKNIFEDNTKPEEIFKSMTELQVDNNKKEDINCSILNTNINNNLVIKQNNAENEDKTKVELDKITEECKRKEKLLNSKLLGLKIDENKKLDSMLFLNDTLEKDINEITKELRDINKCAIYGNGKNTSDFEQIHVIDSHFELTKLYNKIFKNEGSNKYNDLMSSMLCILNEYENVNNKEVEEAIEYFDQRIFSNMHKIRPHKFKNILPVKDMVECKTEEKFKNVVEGIKLINVKNYKILKTDEINIKLNKNTVSEKENKEEIPKRKEKDGIESNIDKKDGVIKNAPQNISDAFKAPKVENVFTNNINTESKFQGSSEPFTENSVFSTEPSNVFNSAVNQYNKSNLNNNLNNVNNFTFNNLNNTNNINNNTNNNTYNNTNNTNNNITNNTNNTNNNTGGSSAFSRFASLKKF